MLDMQEAIDFMADDYLQTTNTKDLESKAKSLATMYAAQAKMAELEVKQQEIEIKRREQEQKEALDRQHLAQEAEAAKKAHRLEVAKTIINGSSVGMSIVLGFAALKDGGLLSGLLRNWRNKTI